MEETTAKSRYLKWQPKRDPYLRRAEQCAKLTIPFVFPEEGVTEFDDLPTPWQSVGSFGVNSLTSKIVLSLFPTNLPFFKQTPDRFELEKAMQAGQLTEEGKDNLARALSEIDKAGHESLDEMMLRPRLHSIIKYLIVTGNCCVLAPHDVSEDEFMVYSLRSYVAKRDAAGNLLEVIIRNTISPTVLPEHVFKELTGEQQTAEEIEIFTVCQLRRERNTKKWYLWQEVEGVKIAEEGIYPFEKCPVMAPRIIYNAGETYGHSYVEAYIGDLNTVDGLMASITQAAAAAARLIFMVKPGSPASLNISKLEKTPNGGFAIGLREDIAPIEMNKGADMAVARQTAVDAIGRLQYAFLMTQSIQRDAERVTAEEIRAMAQELDSSLGQLYSLLAGEVQVPVAKYLMNRLAKQKKIPSLPKGSVKIVVSTGLPSIGRGNELNKLVQLNQYAAATGASAWINQGANLRRAGNELALDTKGLIKTEEEMSQEMQQAQTAQMLQAATPNAVKGMMDAATSGKAVQA